MKKGEMISRLIVHYSETISCKNCIIKLECDSNFQSQKECENNINFVFIQAEK